MQKQYLIYFLAREPNGVKQQITTAMKYHNLSVNSILFKYKYIMIQTIYIHKTLHLKGIQK